MTTTIADRLSRFTYRPGWTIRVGQREGHDGDWLLITCPTVDAYDPSRRITLPGGRLITRAVQVMDDEQLTAWVLGLIDDIERHERDEWFRRDGQLVNDPHKPVAPATDLGTGSPCTIYVPPEYCSDPSACRVHWRPTRLEGDHDVQA